MPKPRTGGLERRKDGWYCRLSIPKPGGGRDRPWYFLGTTDETEAKRKRDQLVAKTFRPEEQRPRRFTEYARSWVEKRAGAGVAFAESEKGWIERYMVPELEDMLLGDVKPAHARKVIERAKAAGLARQTIVHIRATLRRIFEQARMDELVQENPVERAPAPKERELRLEREKRGLPARAKKEREILRDEEVLKLIACPDVDLEIRLLSLCARAEGGMRTRDLTSWDWTHIERPSFASCIVPRTKTSKPQPLEIPEILQPAIRAWWTAAGSPTKGPVFPVTRGPRKGEARKTRGVSFADRLRRALVIAKVSRLPLVRDGRGKLVPDPRDPLFFETNVSLPVDFHSFRRAFGTAMANAGIAEREAMRLGGWATSSAYGRYVSTSEEAKKIPAAALPTPAQPKTASQPIARVRRFEDPTTGEPLYRLEPPSPEVRREADAGGVAALAGLGVAVARMSRGFDEAEALVESAEGGR